VIRQPVIPLDSVEFVDERQLAYLLLNERMHRAIQGKAQKSEPVFIGPERTLMYKAIAKRHF